MNIKEKVVVNNIKRLNNSINGNPQYMIYTDNGVARTEKDSMLAYKYNWYRFEGNEVEIEYYFKNDRAYLTKIEKV
jgi:hypothetical protein